VLLHSGLSGGGLKFPVSISLILIAATGFVIMVSGGGAPCRINIHTGSLIGPSDGGPLLWRTAQSAFRGYEQEMSAK